MTCNQKQQPGLREIRAWVNNGEWKKHYKGFYDLDFRDHEEIENQVDQAASGLILRNWMEIQRLFLQHIETSNNPRLFCNVEHLFVKSEYQDSGSKRALGNLPHLHMMICTREKPWTEQGKAALENIIRAYAEDIVRDTEIEQYFDEGIFNDISEHPYEIRFDVATKLGHGTCTFPRCLERIGPGDNDFRCRVPDNYLRSPNHRCHSYSERQPEHRPDALRLLLDLHLLEQSVNGDPTEYRGVHPSLRSLQHFPPTMRLGEKISPCVPLAFFLFRSNQNVQMIATYQTSRYIEKYCGQIDLNNSVFVSMHGKEKNTAIVRANFLHNTKITGSAINEEIAIQNKKHASHPRARGKSLMEIEQIVLGYPTNYTSIEYIHVSTHPMEERKGFDRVAPIDKINDARLRRDENPYETVEDLLDASIPAISCRDTLPTWRRFSQNQEITIKDNLFSSISVDKITRFSLRPPELRCFDVVSNYFAWFSISKQKISCPLALSLLIRPNLRSTAWVDGLGNMVQIRPTAIEPALQFLQNYNGPCLPQPCLRTLFWRLNNLHQKEVSGEGFTNEHEQHLWKDLKFHLVDQKASAKLPVVVFSSIKPKNATRFLVHVLLSMGQFETEFELLAQPSMKAAFVKANLFHDHATVQGREESCNTLLKRFITEQLAFYPVSTRSFDYYLLQAKQIFLDVLVHDEMPIFELPPVLFTSLRDQWSDTVTREIKRMKEIHVDVCLKELHHLSGIPTKEEIMNDITKDNPHNWTADLDRNENIQSIESHAEQVQVVSLVKEAIHKYAQAGNTFTKSLIINGPPGCGKTFLMMVASLLGLSKGLTVTPTALMAERASTLGGTYIHKLFCIPPNNYTPQRVAEIAILRILHRPVILQFLLTVDIICWDEAGQNPAQLLATCDIIMRRLRGSDLFFGGVLLFFTLDHLQLRPQLKACLSCSPHTL